MTIDEHYQALERAAAPALAAIAEDAGRAPEWLRPLFDKMGELLFELDLELDQILKAAGFSDPDVWIYLREEVDQAPWSYLRDGRLETAAHLLHQTKISISEIGYLVGYGSASTFRRPLQEFLGMPPSRYRRQAPRLLARARRAGPAPDRPGAECVTLSGRPTQRSTTHHNRQPPEVAGTHALFRVVSSWVLLASAAPRVPPQQRFAATDLALVAT